MSFDVPELRATLARHGRVARVVIAEHQGSAPREAGASMLVWPDGQSGTIGGGALEHEAAERARTLLGTQADIPARVERLPLGPGLGQCCGGAVTLVTEVWDAARLDTALKERAGLVVRQVTPEAETTPPLPVQRLLARARNDASASDMTLAQGWLVEPVQAAQRQLWVWGAGHVGRAIVATVAPLRDFDITWVDTASERFPDRIPDGVTQLVAVNPPDLVKHAPPGAEHLVLTFSHAIDLELCNRLLSHGSARTGLIGSRTKWTRFRNRLRALGHSDAAISSIVCPIGDPSLGKEPQAIAVGVAGALLRSQTTAEAGREDAH